jgi:hypothetical protein
MLYRSVAAFEGWINDICYGKPIDEMRLRLQVLGRSFVAGVHLGLENSRKKSQPRPPPHRSIYRRPIALS